MNTPTLTTPIWVVEGSSGEYSDYTNWIVCAYHTEADAERHANLADTRSQELDRKYAGVSIPANANEYDPQWKFGSYYHHHMTELRSMPAT